MKSNEVTYVSFKDTTKDTDKVKVYPETDFEELNKAHVEAGEQQADPIAVQTFNIPDAETREDTTTLVPDETEFLNIFQRGYNLKGQQAIYRLMKDPKFTSVEGVYDLTQACAVRTERARLSKEEKAERLLSELSPDVIARILAKLAQGAVAPA